MSLLIVVAGVLLSHYWLSLDVGMLLPNHSSYFLGVIIHLHLLSVWLWLDLRLVNGQLLLLLLHLLPFLG